MYKQEMDFHSICLGPFPSKVASFGLKITRLVKGEKKARYAGEKTVNFDCEEKLMGALNQDSLADIDVMKWIPVPFGGEDKFFLIIRLFSLDQLPRISGDFKFKFESRQPKCKFYFWLNVAAILYNNELKDVTAKRNELRNKGLLNKNRAPSPKHSQLLNDESKDSLEERKEVVDDRWVPIHFEDFTEIEESSFMNDK